MFKTKKVQKENHMSFFIGGTAIGMATGLLAGRLFSNISIKKNQKFGPEILINKNMKKYSQDDNIYDVYFNRNHHNIRSESASRYNEENLIEKPLSPISLNKFDDKLKNDINNFNLSCKCNKNEHKVFHDNKNHIPYNISIENNNEYNALTDISPENTKEETKNNNYFKLENTKQESSYAVQSENNVSVKAINVEKETSRTAKIYESMQLTDIFNSLSINFCENSTIYNNHPNIINSGSGSNISSSYTDNASNMATYDTTYFENAEQSNIFNFSSIEDFYETDIISSTKQNNFNDI
ncbi:GATA zinc finger domain-containing protein 15-like [Bombus pyrosoma]|uniref:GATA zinc finger domain-containing protein 15-like n=1 Tax=Bombus pyrosoma TaxID=396416 RepID=UPI001CB90F7B|nr:GATA zinc finger domain-containing protein 15-like [Bombus pyrosoma]